MSGVILNDPLSWDQVAAVAADGATLELGAGARQRLEKANGIVRAIVNGGIRAYGVNTGVGALSDVVIPVELQGKLSRNILLSHSVGLGTPLPRAEARAIMVAAINNFALGFSGLRPAVVERMIALLNAGCTPEIPHQGSVGYISHMAHIGLVLIGHGYVDFKGQRLAARDALSQLGLEPLVLEAKEGLCLVNGTPCVTGLGSLATARMRALLAWADAVGAMSYEATGCQLGAIHTFSMKLRASPGLLEVTDTLNALLEGSAILSSTQGRRTQDALSLRSIPQVHGAVRDSWTAVATVVDRELGCVTDNPVVAGTAEAPEVYSEAHAVGAAMGLAMDQLAVAAAELGVISERRMDRLVNPLVSGLPAFLAEASGVSSGFMIAQYAATSLVAENRRLAAPASLDGGVTSGLQEDFICHATPAAIKCLAIIGNVEAILAIELMAACQAYDLTAAAAAPRTRALHDWLRTTIAKYGDDRPLGEDMAAIVGLMRATSPADILAQAGHAV